jgi:hypothetical protein
MYLLIRYPVGTIVEGVVLAHRKNRMRVAAAGFSDIIELRRSGAEWFTSTRQPVEFDFLMSASRRAPCLLKTGMRCTRSRFVGNLTAVAHRLRFDAVCLLNPERYGGIDAHGPAAWQVAGQQRRSQ